MSRSGLATPEEQREFLATLAAYVDEQSGREWRPLLDTAAGTQVLWGASPQWASWRRGTDYYEEGLLVWLEADVLIRQKTAGRSLDDFCRAFFGGASGPPAVVPYTYDDVVRALNDIAPYDWRAFLAARLDSTSAHAPLGGIEAAGWRLGATDTLTAFARRHELLWGWRDFFPSIGLRLDKDGAIITDVRPGSVADRAGLAPGMKPIAVNGRRFTLDRLREAVEGNPRRSGPLEIVAENDEFLQTFTLDYHGGLRTPVLERDASKPDLLSEILRARTPWAAGGAVRNRQSGSRGGSAPTARRNDGDEHPDVCPPTPGNFGSSGRPQ